MDKCLELGADNVVNHREADWYKKVRDITDKKGGSGIIILLEKKYGGKLCLNDIL